MSGAHMQQPFRRQVCETDMQDDALGKEQRQHPGKCAVQRLGIHGGHRLEGLSCGRAGHEWPGH